MKPCAIACAIRPPPRNPILLDGPIIVFFFFFLTLFFLKQLEMESPQHYLSAPASTLIKTGLKSICASFKNI